MTTTTRPACCYDGPRSCGGTCDYASAEQARREAVDVPTEPFRLDAVDLTGRGPAGRAPLADGDPF